MFSAPIGSCAGFWMRKPDGALSNFYLAVLKHLFVNPDSYIKLAYQFYMDRMPDAAGSDYWKGIFRSKGLNAADQGLQIGEETLEVFVKRLFLNLLGRVPSSQEAALWKEKFKKNNADKQQIIKEFSASFGKSVVCADKLAKGTSLTPGSTLVSCDGNYTLTLQSDGNLVLTQAPAKIVWASDTGGNGQTRLQVQDDGNVVLVKLPDGTVPIWATNTGGSGDVSFVLQNDGNLVVYGAAGNALWDKSALK